MRTFMAIHTTCLYHTCTKVRPAKVGRDDPTSSGVQTQTVGGQSPPGLGPKVPSYIMLCHGNATVSWPGLQSIS